MMRQNLKIIDEIRNRLKSMNYTLFILDAAFKNTWVKKQCGDRYLQLQVVLVVKVNLHTHRQIAMFA